VSNRPNYMDLKLIYPGIVNESWKFKKNAHMLM